MSKNLMPEVAKMLGLEIGEKFIIENTERNVCVVLAADGLHIAEDDYLGIPNGKLLQKVLCGLYEVKKLPWEPKEGERYFYPSISAKRVDCTNWICGSFDYAMKALGMVYKTLEEAQECFPEDYEKLTGNKLEG